MAGSDVYVLVLRAVCYCREFTKANTHGVE